MKGFPKKLQEKLDSRANNNALRQLGNTNNIIDFSSNDYLGFAKSKVIFNETHQYLVRNNLEHNGATGSRLLSGNHILYQTVENLLCDFHNAESALIFNSGYDANLGFFASIPQRGDIILYDEYSHASIRDGITMSPAKSYKFKHNDLKDLEKLIIRHSELVSEAHAIYVVTESVFSMDGDSPDLKELSKICKAHQSYLIVDEAHALGVFGVNGSGIIQEQGLEDEIFARIVTFGKGLGCHGAAILGSNSLKTFLINFTRSFIYTTALSPHALGTIKTAYENLSKTKAIEKLHYNINSFSEELKRLQLEAHFINSSSAIQSCIISGNDAVKTIAQNIHAEGFDVKPILSPTVPQGEERLRFCLHSYNSKTEITKVLELLCTFVS